MARPEEAAVAMAGAELELEQEQEQEREPEPELELEREPAREWVAVANSSWTPGSLDSRYHRNP